MAWSVADRLGLIGPLMEQPGYSLLNRQKVEGEFQLLYENYGLGLTIFSPLKTGILTGKYNDGIPEGSRYKNANDKFSVGRAEAYGDEQWTRDIELTRKLKPIADKLGTDLTSLAYAWVVKNPHVTSAITGASKVEQVGQAIKSLELLDKLTPEVLKEIDDTLGNKPPVLTRRF